MSAAELRTERLLLDAVTPADTDAVFEYCQDAELQRFVPVPSPYTREAAEGFTGEYARSAAAGDEFTLWAIRDPASRTFMGTIELRNHPVGGAGVGFWLGRPHRGGRVMTEALEAVVEFAFAGEGIEVIEWSAVVDNVGSAIVAWRCGFHFEGTRRRSLFRDTRVDAWYASILRDDDRTPQEGWPL